MDMTDDLRTIREIWGENGNFWIKVGVNGVEKIDVYREAGQMGYVPWFAIWEKGEISQRINAQFLEGITYEIVAFQSLKDKLKEAGKC